MKNNKNTKTVSMKIILTESQADRLISNIKNAEKFKVKKWKFQDLLSLTQT